MGGKARPRAGGGEGDEDDASAARELLVGVPEQAKGLAFGQSTGCRQRWCCTAAEGEVTAIQTPPAQRSSRSRRAGRDADAAD